MRTTRRCGFIALGVMAGVLAPGGPASAHAPSGAIFTTVADGSEVNFNHYQAKEDVYLDGGPGPGAPQTAAGLDDGTYVFQVTDPSGKTLLSQDAAECRQFTVADGIITSVAPSGACQHVTGIDVDHGALTVQLVPYADTPNPGGVYKVWVTFLEDFLAGCAELGVSNGLSVVDCGNAPGNRHGFVPRHSKTDNFKVKAKAIVEIDTRFFRDADGDGVRSADEAWIDGLGITWTDTLGASNRKWSYYAPQNLVFHEAHVEAVETGTHAITVADQAGCTVGTVVADGVHAGSGPRTVEVRINTINTDRTVFIDVACG